VFLFVVSTVWSKWTSAGASLGSGHSAFLVSVSQAASADAHFALELEGAAAIFLDWPRLLCVVNFDLPIVLAPIVERWLALCGLASTLYWRSRLILSMFC